MGNVAFMGDRRGAYKVLVGKCEGKRHRGRPGVDGRKIMGIWNKFKNLFDQAHGHMAGCFESGNEDLFA